MSENNSTSGDFVCDSTASVKMDAYRALKWAASELQKENQKLKDQLRIAKEAMAKANHQDTKIGQDGLMEYQRILTKALEKINRKK